MFKENGLKNFPNDITGQCNSKYSNLSRFPGEFVFMKVCKT